MHVMSTCCNQLCVHCKNEQLTGPSEQLKGKRLRGFLAGRTLPAAGSGKLNEFVQECRERGYGILVPNGRSLGLGNSRVPRLHVECALRTTMPGRVTYAARRGSCASASSIMR